MVLPRPGTPSSSACDPASMHVSTPSITSRLPTMTLPTSSRSSPMLRWNSATSARAASLSFIRFCSREAAEVGSLDDVGSRLLSRSDQLEIPMDVESVPVGYLVLVDLLLGDGAVLREHLLVTGAFEPAFGRAEDDFAVG